MNKRLSFIILLLFSVLLFLIQKNIFSNFTIAGISPNIFIIYILFLGLYTNSKVSISIGVFLGLVLDAVYGKCIGISSMMFCAIAYLTAYFDKNFSKDNRITIMLMAVGATLMYEFGAYSIASIIFKFDFEFLYFMKIVSIEVLYNVLLLILLYPLFQKFGYTLDRTFKKSNLLTRYF